MDIIIKRSNEVTYGDLNYGEVFQHEGNTYMLTDQREEDTDDDYKSVNLETGEMEIFGSKVVVHLYDRATITLD